MGNVVHLMTVIPVITFIKGNAKSGDTLISCFGGKNCIARVPRMCLCGKADFDNPLHRCLWIRMAYQRALNEKRTSYQYHQRQVQTSFLNPTIRGEHGKRG
jgi:hypothetical protein